MNDLFKDPLHLSKTAEIMGRCCKSWQSSTAQYHFAVRDTLLKQIDRIEFLEAEIQRLRRES